MAQFADRVAYRLAGFVWTAIYSSLCSPQKPARTTAVSVFETSALEGAQQPVAA